MQKKSSFTHLDARFNNLRNKMVAQVTKPSRKPKTLKRKQETSEDLSPEMIDTDQDVPSDNEDTRVPVKVTSSAGKKSSSSSNSTLGGLEKEVLKIVNPLIKNNDQGKSNTQLKSTVASMLKAAIAQSQARIHLEEKYVKVEEGLLAKLNESGSTTKSVSKTSQKSKKKERPAPPATEPE